MQRYDFQNKERVNMIKVLFICHGNICRSPMAEYIMKHLVKEAGVAEQFEIDSAATSTEEIGNDMYPPAKRKLTEHGIPFGCHAARQLRRSDYEYYDYLIGMDVANMRNISRICGCGHLSSSIDKDLDDKVAMLMDFTDTPGSVADPWYTGDFEITYRDILAGCEGLLNELLTN